MRIKPTSSRQLPLRVPRRAPFDYRALVIGAGVVLAYFPAIRSGYIWDDEAFTENPLISQVSGLWKIWLHPSLNVSESHYWPVTYSVFWLQYRLWGISPIPAHLVNILLHIANSFLLCRLLLRLRIPVGGFAAALFALHPMHAESVAWVIELKDVLSTFFYLLAFIAYVRFLETEDRGSYVFALLLFIFGILSKSNVLTFPFAIAILLYWRNKDSEPGQTRVPSLYRNLLLLVPYLLAGAIFAIFDTVSSNHLDHAIKELQYSPVQRIMIASRAAWFYSVKLFWPGNLASVYSRWNISPLATWQFVFPAAWVVLLCVLWLGRRRTGSGALAAIVFYLITAAPILGFIPFGFQRYSFVADRFVYLAGIGFIVLACAAVVRITQKNAGASIATFGGWVLLAVLGLLTYNQSIKYKNPEIFFREMLRKNPDAWVAYHNLGSVSMRNNQVIQAVQFQREAFRRHPSADYELALAEALDANGNVGEARQHYEEVLRLQPGYGEAHINYGNLLDDLGLVEKALEHYREGVRLSPELVEGHNSYGTALARLGKFDEAIEEFNAALKIEPGNANARENLNRALADRAAKANKEP